MSLSLRKKEGGSDYVILISTGILVIFGLVALASASSSLGKNNFNDSYYYLKHQAMLGLSLGLAGFFLGSKLYYKTYEKIAPLILLISLLVLLLTFTSLGLTAGGATRWLRIGPVTFQPSEVLKLSFPLYLAAWLGNTKKKGRQLEVLKSFVPFLIITGAVLYLLLKQPATSTAAILISTAFIMYFVSGARISYLLSIVLVTVVVFGAVIYFTPYRLNRITAFLEPDKNQQTTSYQLNQSKIAIGSGGLLGVGYGQSTTKIKYLPEPIHDSIFAVIAEEFGFVGAVALLGTLLTLILRMLILAWKSHDKFGQLLLAGFASLIAIQSFVNIGAISGLLPLTGTPLPFISYGGTALAVFMTMTGISLNISKYT